MEFCRVLRGQGTIGELPLLLLASPSDKDACIEALELGADDFVLKPFQPRELLARLHVALRRNRFHIQGNRIEVGGIIIDVRRHEVTYNGSKINLTAAEFRILRFLAEGPDHVRSRQEISLSAGGDQLEFLNRMIDAHFGES